MQGPMLYSLHPSYREPTCVDFQSWKESEGRKNTTTSKERNTSPAIRTPFCHIGRNIMDGTTYFRKHLMIPTPVLARKLNASNGRAPATAP
jgi:hypothetical protein